MRHKPYGELRRASGADMPTDKRFTGQMAQTAGYVGSLYDYSARFYSPALGRFVSADTPTDFTFVSQRAGSYGTIVMSAREYLPSLGRFLSADSIVPGAGNPQALNRYAYVFNSPLKFVDPDGHGPICPNCQFGPFANFSFAEFVAGFSLQYADNLALGIPSGAVEQVNDALTTNPSEAFQSGRQAADVVGFLQGAAELVGGIAGAVTLSGGEVVCVAGTAGLCLAAAPAVIAIDAGALALAGHGAAMMHHSAACPGCGTENTTIQRTKGKIADKQHIDPAQLGRDGLSAYCRNCSPIEKAKWTTSIDELREFARRIGLDPAKAAVYTEEFGGKGHYSLFVDAFGADGKLLPEYGDLIDNFFRR
ncbi:MAG: RHS repeat-associated core domain-containing protein [Thermoflexales bacterium]